MKIAIIAEYNPFHNGHIYQLNYAKKNFPNDKILIVLSGKYVQRGELAIASFNDRKNVALKYGADEVVELPFEFATQAAHIFAEGAVRTAIKYGADKLLFGSESNDVANMIEVAKVMKERKSEYKVILKSFLKQGLSFPKSNALALETMIGQSFVMPNDILGMEYIKTIVFNDLKLKPFSLKRTVEFHSEDAKDNFASASLIRIMIKNEEDVSKYTPMSFKMPIDVIENHYHDFQKIVTETSAEELANIKMISEGMENLFKKHIDAKSYEEFVNRTNSRRYTSSRIKRVMLYVLLKIKK